MNEARKAKPRILKYLNGRILDIGGGQDPIAPEAEVWEVAQGDAQYLDCVEDEQYDTVFSSHCLEHMRSPLEALLNWYRVLKPGGYLIVLAPEEDLYEQHLWPSHFNDDHKWGVTLHKDQSWHPQSCNLLDIVRHLYRHKLVSLSLQDRNYDYTQTGCDQTQDPNIEAAVELILKKQSWPDGAWASPLTNPIRCPRDGALMVAQGCLDPGMLRLQCTRCGALGEVNLEVISAASSV